MQFYTNRTVREQADRLPLELREKYLETQLDRVEIDGQVLQGYFEYSFLEEKSYVEQPTRSNDGSIIGLEDMKTFLTPRLIIKYNMMDIEDYRKLMKLLRSKNTFMVTCYDIVEDKRVTHEMYFAPPSMPVIYQQYLMTLGVQDFAIELIGTNADPSVQIVYHYNLDKVQTFPNYDIVGVQTVVNTSKYDMYTIIDPMVTVLNLDTATNETLPLSQVVQSHSLATFNTDPLGNGINFALNGRYYIGKSLILYAIWD